MMKRTQKKETSQPKFATLREVREYLRISRVTLWRMIKRKEIPAAKFGRITRIPWSVVHEMAKVSE